MKRQTGSIRQLSPGKWLVQASYYVKDPYGNFVLDDDGRKIRKRLTSREPTTEREARRKLLELMDQADRMHEAEVVKIKVERSMKFGTFLEVQWFPFLYGKIGGDQSPASARTHEGRIRNHVLPYDIADIPCWDLECLAMDQWMAALRKAKPNLKETTLASILDSVRMPCRQAVAWKLMSQDPIMGMGNKPHPRPFLCHEITLEEAETLMLAFWDHPFGLPFALPLTLGLRPGEICGLRWCDFDFDEATVTPVRNVTRGENGRGLMICRTKTEGSAETAEIPDGLMPLVRAYRRRRMEQNLAWGNPDALIVTSARGGLLEPGELNRRFQVLRKSLGLPEMRLYDGRHAMINLALDAGASIYDVSKMARHSRTDTTTRFYARDDKKRRRDLANLVGGLILPQREAKG